MTFTLYAALFFIVFVGIPSLISAISNKGYLTPEEMADNVERGLLPDGRKLTLRQLEELSKTSEWNVVVKSQYELADQVLKERCTGKAESGNKIKANGKKSRVKLF